MTSHLGRPIVRPLRAYQESTIGVNVCVIPDHDDGLLGVGSYEPEPDEDESGDITMLIADAQNEDAPLAACDHIQFPKPDSDRGARVCTAIGRDSYLNLEARNAVPRGLRADVAQCKLRTVAAISASVVGPSRRRPILDCSIVGCGPVSLADKCGLRCIHRCRCLPCTSSHVTVHTAGYVCSCENERLQSLHTQARTAIAAAARTISDDSQGSQCRKRRGHDASAVILFKHHGDGNRVAPRDLIRMPGPTCALYCVHTRAPNPCQPSVAPPVRLHSDESVLPTQSRSCQLVCVGRHVASL